MVHTQMPGCSDYIFIMCSSGRHQFVFYSAFVSQALPSVKLQKFLHVSLSCAVACPENSSALVSSNSQLSLFSSGYLPDSVWISVSCTVAWKLFPGSKWNKVNWLSHVRLFATPWTVAYKASLFMELSRQKYWNGLLFPSPGDLPKLGIEPWTLALWADTLPSEPPCNCRARQIFLPSLRNFYPSLSVIFSVLKVSELFVLFVSRLFQVCE